MRRLSIIVKPFKLDDVMDALAPFHLDDVQVEEARGYGRQKGHLDLYSGSEYSITFLPKVRLDLLCEDAQVPAIVRAVEEAARTGRIGDGKVFVMPATLSTVTA